MPTYPRKARILLKEDKAKVVRVHPFTIQLKYVTGETKQPVVIGIDDGVKNAGIAVVANKEVILKGNIKIRNNVKKLISLRKARRQQRRHSLRHRQPRYLNNSWDENWLSPSVRVRKDNIIRVVKEIQKLIPLSLIRVERTMFNVAQLASDKKLEGKDYQNGLAKGWDNRKHAVLFRDNYICQYCGKNIIKSNLVAEVDHIIPRSRGGKDNFKNLVTACRDCNQAKVNKTAKEFGYPNLKGADFSVPTLMNIGKNYLFKELNEIAITKKCFGYETKNWRKKLKLGKDHFNDAIAITTRGKRVENIIEPMNFIARRRNRDIFSLKLIEFKGLRHWDLVKVTFKRGKKKHQSFLGTVKAFVSKREKIKVRLLFNTNHVVKLSQVSLVQRSKGVIFLST